MSNKEDNNIDVNSRCCIRKRIVGDVLRALHMRLNHNVHCLCTFPARVTNAALVFMCTEFFYQYRRLHHKWGKGFHAP